MAIPVIVACPAETWTLVATNVTSGFVHILDESPAKYYQTYRPTGGLAPTTKTEAVPFTTVLQISASSGIDVYIMAVVSAGSVRVDL